MSPSAGNVREGKRQQNYGLGLKIMGFEMSDLIETGKVIRIGK